MSRNKYFSIDLFGFPRSRMRRNCHSYILLSKTLQIGTDRLPYALRLQCGVLTMNEPQPMQISDSGSYDKTARRRGEL